jgi:4-amino-4-deoxy-L-arabinose transferase-like glycosyltransferase
MVRRTSAAHEMTITTFGRQPSWTGQRLPAIVDFATRTHARAALVLVVFALLAFLPGFFQVPPIDRDEARFAQASKQMVETRDYIDIHFQDEVRYKKPAGIYWLQAGVVSTARALGMPDALRTIWLYRLPSLLAAIGAVLLTYWAALPFLSRRGAVLAGLLMAGSVLLGVEARLGKTDAVLLLTAVAAMGAEARAYLGYDPRAADGRAGWRNPAIFWTAMAAGMLVKGPLILMFAALTAIALGAADRSLRWVRALRPAGGVVWFLLLVLPWFLAIMFRSHGSFFANSVGNDMLAKVASGQESHSAPPGYYLLLFWVTFWPGAMLAGLAAPAVWKNRREPTTRFLLAWIVPSWIVFELVATKLPHYVLPLYPAIAILLVGVAERGMLSRRNWLTLGTLWWFLFPLIVTGAAIAGVVILQYGWGLLAWPFAAGAVIFGLLAWRLYGPEDVERAVLRALVASVLVAFAVYGVALPSMTKLFPSTLLADVLAHASCRNPQAAAVGFQEPSLIFLAGTATVLTDAVGAADFLQQGGCRYAFVEAKAEPRFLQRAATLHLRYAPGPRIDAINYSSGHPVTIAVYRAGTTP